MDIEPDFNVAREYSCTSAVLDYQRWPIDKLAGIAVVNVTVVTHVIIVVLARVACFLFTTASLDSVYIVHRAK